MIKLALQNGKNMFKKTKNTFYYPEILDYLMTYYFPFLPFWTGIILNKIKGCRPIVTQLFKIVIKL